MVTTLKLVELYRFTIETKKGRIQSYIGSQVCTSIVHATHTHTIKYTQTEARVVLAGSNWLHRQTKQFITHTQV